MKKIAVASLAAAVLSFAPDCPAAEGQPVFFYQPGSVPVRIAAQSQDSASAVPTPKTVMPDASLHVPSWAVAETTGTSSAAPASPSAPPPAQVAPPVETQSARNAPAQPPWTMSPSQDRPAPVFAKMENASRESATRHGPFFSLGSSAFITSFGGNDINVSADMSEWSLKAGWDIRNLLVSATISGYEWRDWDGGAAMMCFGAEAGREWNTRGSVVRLGAGISASYCNQTGYHDARVSIPFSLMFGLGETIGGKTWAKAVTAGVTIQPEIFVPNANYLAVPVFLTLGSHVLPFGQD